MLLSPEKTLAHISADQIRYAERAYIGDAGEYSNFRALARPYSGPETRFVLNSDGKSQNAIVTEGEKETLLDLRIDVRKQLQDAAKREAESKYADEENR